MSSTRKRARSSKAESISEKAAPAPAYDVAAPAVSETKSKAETKAGASSSTSTSPSSSSSSSSSVPVPVPAALSALSSGHYPISVLPSLYCSSTVALAFGSGDMSQLGLGHEETMRERKKPTLIKVLEASKGLKSIASGALHNAIILSNGSVWTWGCNDDAALGRDGDEWFPEPVEGPLGHGSDPKPEKKVEEKSNKKAKKNEEEEGEGKMEVEKADNDSDEEEEEEEEIDDGRTERAIQVECGASHSLALTENGHVYSWGTYRDANGIIGYNEKKKRAKRPYDMTPFMSKAGKGATIVHIASGDNHSLALNANGEVFQWGYIGIGQRLSDRTKRSRLFPSTVFIKDSGPKRKKVKVVSVWAGGAGSFAVDEGGRVWAWGPNNYFQLGLPQPEIKGKQKADAVTITSPTLIEGLPPISKVATAIHHTLFLTKDGKVYAAGRAHEGRLGIGSYGDSKYIDKPALIPTLQWTDDKVIDIAVGEAHSIAITERGRLFAWGSSELYQTGHASEDDVEIPKEVTGQQLIGKIVLQAKGGSQHTLILAAPSDKSPYTTAAPAASAAAPSS